MRGKKILGIFDRRPLIWFHYVLLVLAVYGAFILGEALFKVSEWGIVPMLLFWFVALSVSDQIIHVLLGVD